MVRDPYFKILFRSGIILCLLNYVVIAYEIFKWQSGWLPVYVFTGAMLTISVHRLWKAKKENDEIDRVIDELLSKDRNDHLN